MGTNEVDISKNEVDISTTEIDISTNENDQYQPCGSNKVEYDSQPSMSAEYEVLCRCSSEVIPCTPQEGITEPTSDDMTDEIKMELSIEKDIEEIKSEAISEVEETFMIKKMVKRNKTVL